MLYWMAPGFGPHVLLQREDGGCQRRGRTGIVPGQHCGHSWRWGHLLARRQRHSSSTVCLPADLRYVLVSQLGGVGSILWVDALGVCV